MKTKLFVALIWVGVSVFGAGYDRTVWRAMTYGAEFDVLFKVVDDEGAPVANAKCSGWMYMETAPKQGSHYSLYTDTNGFVRVAGKCGEWFSVVLCKEGYYDTMLDVKYPNRNASPMLVDGKWQPYGETRTVVLKRIRKPRKMLGPDRPPQRKIRIYDKWLEFDLERGDFLPPIGNGHDADMLIRFRLHGRMPDDWSIAMDVSFTNHPHAGAYRLKKDTWSDMKSSYCADANAMYQANFTFKYCHEKGVYPHADKLGKDEYMVFRTRTRVDRDGNLLSARYGKLYGPWHFEDAGGAKIHKVFMNALDNDVNLEDTWTIEESKKYR
ncbi:MAG: hypothetical protein Q4G65_03815 [bacterium]|nr:hypothetical protein [bacterium]